jgi:hypothetical protein
MTYKVELKGEDKEEITEIELIEELEELLEEFGQTDEIKVEKVLKKEK